MRLPINQLSIRSRAEIDNIERTVLSIGMSLAFVPLVGFLLNYTPWGIRLTPITISLLALTIILSITGLIREHPKKSPKNRQRAPPSINK